MDLAEVGRFLEALWAKRFVNDVAAWAGTTHAELTKVLPFLGGNHA